MKISLQINEMLRFMLKPDKRTHGCTDTCMEGIYNRSTTAFAFHDLSLQSEATASLIREKSGRFSVTTSFNLEAGVKGQI